MKVSCEVIKDLLPLYHDGVCSNDSKRLVKEHLAACVDCRNELQAMSGALSFGDPVAENLKEADAVKKLSKEWKKNMLKSLLYGILLTAAAALLFYIFFDIKIIFSE